MKIKFINWVNLVLSILCFTVAIICFCNGKYWSGVADLVISGLNLYVFLVAVSYWWETSEKITKTFVFTCPSCGKQFKPTFWRWFLVPHIGSRRYFKCEQCKKISWMRRK